MTSTEIPDYIFKIIFAGDSSVGKSNIISRFYKDKFTENLGSTVGVEFYSKVVHCQNNKLAKLQIWDTAGQERFRSITSSYYKGAKGAFLVYDVTRKSSFETVQGWFRDIVNLTGNKNVIVILVGNKSDLVNEREVTEDEGKDLAKTLNIPFFETSALTGSNIKLIFEEITNKISSNYKEEEPSENKTLDELHGKNILENSEKEEKKCC